MTRATRCEVCIYCRLNGTTYSCHRYPPTIPSMFPGGMPTFPEVEMSDWCGEYKYDGKNEDKKSDSGKMVTDLIIEHYQETFRRIFGATPQITVKDRNCAKLLAREHTLDQARSIVTEFLEHPPQWHKERNAFDLKFIPSNANSILARGKGIAVDDTMSFLKTQADHRHSDRWFEYVDYMKKSGQKKTFEEWNV